MRKMELGESMVLMNLKNGEFAVKVILGILIVASIVALFKIWLELKKRKDVIAFFNKYDVIGKLEYEQAFKIEVMEYKLKDTNRNLKFWVILTIYLLYLFNYINIYFKGFTTNYFISTIGTYWDNKFIYF